MTETCAALPQPVTGPGSIIAYATRTCRAGALDDKAGSGVPMVPSYAGLPSSVSGRVLCLLRNRAAHVIRPRARVPYKTRYGVMYPYLQERVYNLCPNAIGR